LSIGLTNGCFDLLHSGHIATLEFARKHCDRLIVGVDDDASVRALKGAGRPIRKDIDRAYLVGALRMVDAVVVFPLDWLPRLVEGIAPDVMVKGSEYADQHVVGSIYAKSFLLAPMVAGISTTEIIERIGHANARAPLASRTLQPGDRGVGVASQPVSDKEWNEGRPRVRRQRIPSHQD
jgi:D-beta-D-heptose 7-phosphate kinase/D-beta-D-heptose 1-phosphate adenosyltransferase